MNRYFLQGSAVCSLLFMVMHLLAEPTWTEIAQMNNEKLREQGNLVILVSDYVYVSLMKQNIRDADAQTFIARYNGLSQKQRHSLQKGFLVYAQATRKNIEHEQLIHGSEELNRGKLFTTIAWAGVGTISLVFGTFYGIMGFLSVEGEPIVAPSAAACVSGICGYIAYLGLWSLRKNFYISRHQKTHLEKSEKNIDMIIAHLEADLCDAS